MWEGGRGKGGWMGFVPVRDLRCVLVDCLAAFCCMAEEAAIDAEAICTVDVVIVVIVGDGSENPLNRLRLFDVRCSSGCMLPLSK